MSTYCIAPATGYERWRQRFLGNSDALDSLPWEDSKSLTRDEARLVGRAVQQFQLGEYARGRGLMRRASACPALAGDEAFLASMSLFIAEEQRHSAMLGRFLDREGIPRLQSHWVDGIFRRLRKLAGLEICLATLVTAEVLAIPFYQALRDATRSPLLRALCVRILCDEAAHLNYQSLTIGLVRRNAGEISRKIRALAHSVLFQCTGVILWQQHRKIFLAAGWNFSRFWTASRRVFARLERQITQVSRGAASADSFDEARLD